jgi:hypothetical protein
LQALRARWTRPCEKADPSQQRLRATSAVQPLIGIEDKSWQERVKFYEEEARAFRQETKKKDAAE